MSECRLCNEAHPYSQAHIYGVCLDCIHRLILEEEDRRQAERLIVSDFETFINQDADLKAERDSLSNSVKVAVADYWNLKERYDKLAAENAELRKIKEAWDKEMAHQAVENGDD